MAANEDTGEFTSAMGLVVHEIIKDRKDEVDAITGGDLGRQLLVRELMMHSYIQGFFEGQARPNNKH
jgi:hypothetical protein